MCGGLTPSGVPSVQEQESGVRAQQIEARDEANAETAWWPSQADARSATKRCDALASRVDGVPPGRRTIGLRFKSAVPLFTPWEASPPHLEQADGGLFVLWWSWVSTAFDFRLR